jgi:quercetin dioxygenase-like cupin family protein
VPALGYVFAGQITVSYADREEVFEAGDAFYMPPGHVPAATEGTELLQFSPKTELAEVIAVISANAARMMPTA